MIPFFGSLLFSLLLPIAAARDPLPARWWDLGHREVARLAELRLTPHTRDAVRDILDGQSLADASVWADNIRNYRHDADPLHYVNIPLRDTAYVPERHCPRCRCIIAAIEDDRRVLANPAAARDARAEALRFLIHFMGDLHQPLHVADGGDRGGNDRAVNLLGNPTNLHKVWDGELIDSSGVDHDGYFEYLRRLMSSLDPAALERGTVVDWAMEGHRIGVERVYRLPKSGRLDRDYVRANRPIIDRQLIAAGVRLAKVLNEALANYPTRAAATSPATGIYTDGEALAHVGQTGTVVGTVAAIFRSRVGNVYLNFGADYPRQSFTALVLAPHGSWTDGLDSLVGRRIGVRGVIVTYQGRVEIVLKESGQIVPSPPAH